MKKHTNYTIEQKEIEDVHVGWVYNNNVECKLTIEEANVVFNLRLDTAQRLAEVILKRIKEEKERVVNEYAKDSKSED